MTSFKSDMYRLKWDQNPVKKIEGLKVSIYKRVLLRAVRQGSGVVKPALKAAAPKRSGAMRVSVGVKSYKTRTGTAAMAIIGAKAGYERQYKGHTIKPGKYWHLVIEGHKGPNGGKATAGNDFVSPAWRTCKNPALQAIRDDVGLGVAEQLKKRGPK